MDYWHNASDVIAGGGLGLVCAWVAYVSYYQNPVSKRAGQIRDIVEERKGQVGGDEALL